MTWHLFCALHADTLLVLGPLCTHADCTEVGRFDVAWPGHGTTPQCTWHRDCVAQIADALGFELQWTKRTDVREIDPPREDEAAVRFAMMEMT